MEQGSPEWFAARLGKATASRMGDLMARTKTGYGASRGNYMAELMVERLTGQPYESYTSPAMQRGLEKEPDARRAYEWEAGVTVTQAGFHDHPSIPMSGGSPDGHVSTDTIVEFKCPNSATHLETLLNGTIKQGYLYQCQFNLACTDREFCDWVSFDDRFPKDMQLFIQRIRRDPKIIATLETEVRRFLTELADMEAALRARRQIASSDLHALLKASAA